MTSRIARIVKRVGLNTTLVCGRKPRIVPMSAQEQRIQEELHRRREVERAKRETRP